MPSIADAIEMEQMLLAVQALGAACAGTYGVHSVQSHLLIIVAFPRPSPVFIIVALRLLPLLASVCRERHRSHRSTANSGWCLCNHSNPS